MFKFLSKIFKKKKEVPEKKKVTENEVSKLIDEIEKNLFEKHESEAKKVSKNFERIRENLKEIADKLRAEEIGFEIDPNLKKKVMSARDNVADKLEYLFNHSSKVEATDWNKFSELRDKTYHLLEEIKDILSKKGELIKIGFKKERGMLDETGANLATILSRMDEILNENLSKLTSINEARENIVRLKELNEQIKKTKEKLSEKEKELQDLRKNQNLVKEKLREIEKSSQFMRKKEIENELKTLVEEELKLESDVKSNLNFIIKGIKKYIHFYGGFLSKEDLKQIKEFIENPTEIILEGREEKIIKILPEVKKLIEEEKIKFDEKTKARILEDINKMPIELSSLKDTIRNIKTEQERLAREFEEIDINEYDNLKETLKVSNQWIKKLENEIPELKKRIEEKEEKVDDIKYEILNLIKENFGIEVEFEDEKSN
ncbi:MAG: hypothetical protein J7K73_00285 [Nanoarchaeota archaeon]|nr:hypothetical protein [Nanoarchaeota archaeon]